RLGTVDFFLPVGIRHSPAAHHASHRFDQFRGIVSNAVFKYDLHVFNRRNVLGKVAPNHNHVGLLAGFDRSDTPQIAEILGSVVSGDMDRLDGGKTGLNQQLDLALVAEAGDDASDSSRIEPGEQ